MSGAYFLGEAFVRGSGGLVLHPGCLPASFPLYASAGLVMTDEMTDRMRNAAVLMTSAAVKHTVKHY